MSLELNGLRREGISLWCWEELVMLRRVCGGWKWSRKTDFDLFDKLKNQIKIK